MTWTKFSRCLLWASMFPMMMVWITSNTHRARYISGSPARLWGVTMVNGSIELFSGPQQEAEARLDTWSDFMELRTTFHKPWGTWSYSYNAGQPVPGESPSRDMENGKWSLQVPVWALWFPAAAFILSFCRVMEKLQGSGRTPSLIEENDDGGGDAVPDSGASTPDDETPGKAGSAANIPLAVSGVLLFLTGFVAGMPGDYWPLHCISSAFAIWGLKEAETPRQRMIGLVLTTLCVTCTVFDLFRDMATSY